MIILVNGFQQKSQKTPKSEIELAEKLKNNTWMKKANNNLTSFSDHLDQQYGKLGTSAREKYEEGFDAFKLGVILQERRKEMRNY